MIKSATAEADPGGAPAATLVWSTLESPMGDLAAVHVDARLCGLDFADNGGRLDQLMAKTFPTHARQTDTPPPDLVEALAAYFAGDIPVVNRLPVTFRGTDFECRVWEALRHIPPGETRSYGALAADLGEPGAARAVGRANGLNPISIVVPCHRVIGADGSLTGYAGGLDRKTWLLVHEGALIT